MGTEWISSILRFSGILFSLLFPLKAEEKGTTPMAFGPTVASPLFKDETKAYGLESIRGERFFATDVNGDTYTDIVVLPRNHAPPVFYIFDPGKKKFSLLEENPFPEVVRASFLIFHDFNKDGVNDVIVSRFYETGEIGKRPLRIFQGSLGEKGPSYQPVSFKSSPMPTASIVLLDYNLDGHIDFFQGNYFEKKGGRRRVSPDILWHGEGMKFQNVNALLEGEYDFNRSKDIHPNARPTIGASLCDVDQNGYPDILTVSTGGQENKMWLNRDNPKDKSRIFRDYGEASGHAEDQEGAFLQSGGGDSFFSLCADYNSDGLVDVAIGEMREAHSPPSRDPSSILTGSSRGFPPKFIRTVYSHEKEKGGKAEGNRRGIFVDLDIDGHIDLLVDNSGFPPDSRFIFFQQQSDHSFVDKAEDYGIDILNPAGTILLDINRDGRMDLLMGQTSLRDATIPGHLFLMVNHIPRKKNRSLRFFLRGKDSNAQGIGASLEVRASGQRRFQRFVQYSFGETPSQMEEGTHVGLGRASPESVEVRWPYLEGLEDKKTPRKVSYNLSSLRFSRHLDLTLCEDGRLLRGITSCGDVPTP